jgi:hypothetical protein
MVSSGCRSQRPDVGMDEAPLAVRREDHLPPEMQRRRPAGAVSRPCTVANVTWTRRRPRNVSRCDPVYSAKTIDVFRSRVMRPSAQDDIRGAGRRAPVWRRHSGRRGSDGRWTVARANRGPDRGCPARGWRAAVPDCNEPPILQARSARDARSTESRNRDTHVGWCRSTARRRRSPVAPARAS